MYGERLSSEQNHEGKIGNDLDKIVLQNNELVVTIKRFGAELKSITYEGREYLWQADPAFWNKTSPVLFPIVGTLRNNHATFEGKDINLPRHGLARVSDFEICERSNTNAVLRLTSNAQTKQDYPFDFVFEVSYKLHKSMLMVSMTVKNPSTQNKLPFCLGGHPAFNVPVQETQSSSSAGAFEDWWLEFSKNYEGSSYRVDKTNGLLDAQNTFTVGNGSHKLGLTHELFDVDTLILKDIPKRRISLMGPTSHGVELVFEDFDFLGIWSAAGNAPFVALEPWQGCATKLTEDDDFSHKEGCTILDPGESKTFTYSIRMF